MDELIELVKRDLHITWMDEDTEKTVSALVADAVVVLNFKLGIADEDADYAADSMERRLFLGYCRYVWNNCVNEFDKAYQNEIMQIRSKYQVKYSEEEETTDE